MFEWPDDLAEIVDYIDDYGNAMTGLRATLVPLGARLAVAERVLPHARTFSDVARGEAFWYENSNGLVEIAVNRCCADLGPWSSDRQPGFDFRFELLTALVMAGLDPTIWDRTGLPGLARQ